MVQYSNKLKSHLTKNENEKATKDKQDDEEFVYPKGLNQYKIIGIRDLTVGIEVDFRREGKDKKPDLPCSSATEMITFYFDNGCEITIRASGTEPKIKWYSEIKKKIETNETNREEFRQKVKEELDHLVSAVVEQFLQPKQNQLIERETTSK